MAKHDNQLEKYFTEDKDKMKQAMKYTQDYVERYFDTWDRPIKASIIAQRVRHYMPKSLAPQDFVQNLVSTNHLLEIIAHDGVLYLYPRKCFRMNKDELLSNLIAEIEIRNEKTNESRARKLKERSK